MKDYAEKTSKIGEYTRLVSEKIDPVTSGLRVFCDLNTLQRVLQLYIEQRGFNHFQTKLHAEIDGANFIAKSITQEQVEAVEASFLVSSGKDGGSPHWSGGTLDRIRRVKQYNKRKSQSMSHCLPFVTWGEPLGTAAGMESDRCRHLQR